jgi:cation diffusion facilitator CzcD-associated flavoprotein CzcO
MPRQTDVTVIGAGPQGLAVAAHLRKAGVDAHIFGEPMGFWMRHMPAGMCLRSLPRASSISDPVGSHSLGRFEAIRGTAPVPIPIDHFIEYGKWFQREVVPDVDRRRVTLVEAIGDGFALTMDDAARVRTRRVVVAAGIDRFAFVPPPFRGVPEALVSHTFADTDFRRFAGKRVVVVGAGQSALESAALLRESEADVEVIVRAERVRWLKELTLDGQVGPRQHVLERLKPPTGVGPPGLNWVIGVPEFYRSLPESMRRYVAWRAIPPAGANWLRPRLRDVPVTLRRQVSRVDSLGRRLRLRFDDGTETEADHVILGTGYAPDVTRYPFLPAALVDAMSRAGGYPVLRAGFESSVPGLHFVGAIAAHSYGPITRFVVASAYTGREVTRHITGRPAPLLDRAW